MSEKSLKPAIRFKGFTDDWEQCKLLDCIQKITDFRGRTPKKLGMDWSESGYLALSALNVKDGYIDFSQDVHYGSQALYDKWMTGNELHKGQVLFTTEAPMGNVAQIPDNRRYILSQRTIAFDVKADLITENFLATVLRTPTVFASLTALSSGGTAKGVSQKSLATVDITIPANLNEQELLASIFSNIDNLITLHQRKYEKLTAIKKALLEKMFPQGDEKTPRIRFKGFTDDWEQRKLSVLCEKFTDGDWIEAKDQSSSGVRLIQTGNIGLGEYLDKPNNRKWISGDTFNRLHCEEVCPGDILISRLSEPAGRACIIPNLGVKMITAVDCTIVRVTAGISKEFLLQHLSSPKYFNEVNTCMAGGTRQRISRSNLANFGVLVPILFEEQELIGGFLCGIDNLITLHQRKVEKLKNIKKSLLEKMFV